MGPPFQKTIWGIIFCHFDHDHDVMILQLTHNMVLLLMISLVRENDHSEFLIDADADADDNADDGTDDDDADC